MTDKDDKAESRRQFLKTTAMVTGGATGIDPARITQWLTAQAQKGSLSLDTAEKLKELAILDTILDRQHKTLSNVPYMPSGSVHDYFTQDLPLELHNMYTFAYRQSRLWEELPNIGEIAAVVARAVTEYDALKSVTREVSARRFKLKKERLAREERKAADITPRDEEAVAKEEEAIQEEEKKIETKKAEIDAKYNVPDYVANKFSGCTAERIAEGLTGLPLERFEQTVSSETLSALHDPNLPGTKKSKELREEIARLLPRFIENQLPGILHKIRVEEPAQYEEYKQRKQKPKTEDRQTETKSPDEADSEPAYFDPDHPYAQLMEDQPVNWRNFANSKKDPEKKR